MLVGDQFLATEISGTVISSSATSVILSVANANRNGLIIHNNSPNKLFLRFGTAAMSASSANFSFVLPADSTYEALQPCPIDTIHGVWGAASGSAMITIYE